MKNKLLRLLLASITLMLCSHQVFAIEISTETTISWALNNGTISDAPTYTGNTADYFSNAHIQLGDHFGQKSGYPQKGNSNNGNGTDQTLFNPAGNTTCSTGEYVEFMIKPKAHFKPTAISFGATRYGTNAPQLKAVWVQTDGTETVLIDSADMARNKHTPHVTTFSFSNELAAIAAARGLCGLRIYISCGNTKQVGLNNITITGTLSGEVVNAGTASIHVNISPEGAGDVAISPQGTEQETGTTVTLKQTKKFGYRFIGWYINHEQVGTADTYTFTIQSNTDITAKYESIDTYALTIDLEGGANDYMVTLSPAPTIVNGVKKYEKGTEVSLTANSNKILTFATWDDNTTASEKKIVMNQNQHVNATYSALEYMAGWDFHKTGKQDRPADFADASNTTATLTMRDATGNSSGWLDKSYAQGGYDGRNAAVNWQSEIGRYYWQTKVNAADYKDIKVCSSMYFKYKAYIQWIKPVIFSSGNYSIFPLVVSMI